MNQEKITEDLINDLEFIEQYDPRSPKKDTEAGAPAAEEPEQVNDPLDDEAPANDEDIAGGDSIRSDEDIAGPDNVI